MPGSGAGDSGDERDDRPVVTLLYQYFYPDDVVSARLYTELATGLSERGWRVIARPANRACHSAAAYPRREKLGEVSIRRVWRPALSPAKNVGRLLSAVWMLAGWSLAAAFSRRHRKEAVIIGTDPIMSMLAAIPWRLFRPRTVIAHWCYDLYPDAAVADGLVGQDSLITRVLRRLAAFAYRRCDLVVDLGSCMGRRIQATEPSCRPTTLTPWALAEPSDIPPADPATRRELFGEARLSLLYSGSFGRAHDAELFLALAQLLRHDGVAFCFAGRGNRMEELRSAIRSDDSNVRFAGFAPEADLERRLSACDLHLVSLRPEWTGTVVPSKFFGALATGRGVLYAGSHESAIADWIREHQVGWVLTRETLDSTAADLRRLAQDPSELDDLRRRCHAAYARHFSRREVLERWDALLRSRFAG